ncbi:MAG TPA: TetR/AcrR family transcriptional regulator [Spirochaetes bacterium]|nr:TetR/AcrR family transcriptional regulator [Spirochaetota bacterium]
MLADNRDRIRIKKDDVAVKNLTRIMDGVLELSARKGFSAMSLRDLSRETGLSMGALYSYFAGKDELLDMIQRQGTKVVGELLAEAASRPAPPRDRLREVVYTHLYLSEMLQSWFYFSFMEAKGLGREQLKKAIETELYTESIIEEILSDGARSGDFASIDVPMTSAAVKALLQDWYLKRWKYSGRGVTVEQYARFMIDLVESYILKKRRKVPARPAAPVRRKK